MIAWWIIPTIVSVLALLSAGWVVFARDWFEAGLAFVVTFVLCGAGALLWIICLLLRVFA